MYKMMIRSGRCLFTPIKNGCESCLKQQKPAFASTFPSLYSINSICTLGSNHQQNPINPKNSLLNLSQQRYLHFETKPIFSGRTEPHSSFLLKIAAAAIGIIIGCGGQSVINNDFVKSFQVFCAPKDGESCVERKCEDSSCLRKNDCEEEMIVKANSELEKVLKEVKTKAIEYTEAAMKAYCIAIAIMKEFMDQGYCVIDADELEPPDYEETWCCVFKIAKERCEKVKEAMQKGQCAWALLGRLREAIESGKNCKYTKCNPLLVTAEESLICAEKELLNLKAEMDCVNSEHEMVDQYREVIENFKKELKTEVDALVESGDCCIQFAEQELALMIMLAYKKTVHAQKEAAQVMICNGDIPEHLQRTQC